MSRINLSVSVLSIGISISTKLLDADVGRKDERHAIGIDQFKIRTAGGGDYSPQHASLSPHLTVTDHNLGELWLAIVECFLALYHNLNILISRCKGAKLFLGARYGFHRILTL